MGITVGFTQTLREKTHRNGNLTGIPNGYQKISKIILEYGKISLGFNVISDGYSMI